jgi:hypothetical protein
MTHFKDTKEEFHKLYYSVDHIKEEEISGACSMPGKK